MDRFAVNIAEKGQYGVVVSVSGELDLATAEELRGKLDPVIVQDAVVVLDGTGMSFLDSSGLRVLLQAANLATSRGAAFRLVAPQAAVRRVLELAGVVDHLAAREDVAAALAG